MSAGICIMNRNAIAMAADSAVTIGDHAAIHNSANKLFSLSNIAPVGVIVYANASFMGVPVEIIIKEYKKHIAHKTYSSLRDYFNDFIEYLEANAHFYRFDINEDAYIKRVFFDLMGGVYGDYKTLRERKQQEKGAELSESEKLAVAVETVEATKHFVDEQESSTGDSFAEYVKERYGSEFRDFLKNEKDFSWLSTEQADALADKACEIYDKKFERTGYVGLAIAGYGDDEIYPSLVHVHLLGFINGKIKYYISQEVSINEKESASIVPFAQVDVMQTFLFGINDQFLGDLAHEIPSQISESIAKMEDSLFAEGKKKDVVGQLVGITGKILQHMQDTAVINYMQPIFESVATLPIEELGLLAESMINITSIRRKVALDRNIGTVGGPIDVSIISKGDGFIWLKRKHYFERKYNPQFFYSHYEKSSLKGDCDDE